MTLYKLAELGANEKHVPYTTEDVAKNVGVSQQTASRRLIEMDREGLIERMKEGRNQTIRLTSEGVEQLTGMYSVLKRVFEAPKVDLLLKGVLFTGLAEGAYYVSKEGYRKQFRAKLGFDPFPGTLNIRLGKGEAQERRLLEGYPSVYIEGFQNQKRSYGPAKCYKAIVEEKVRAAIILPIRAHYGEDVIEIISPESLRNRLTLKDGDVVGVRVFLHPD